MNVVRKLVSRRPVAFVSGGAVLAGGSYWYLNSGPAYPLSTKNTRRPPPQWTPPSREQMLDALRIAGSASTEGSQSNPDAFDLLIVGGGATGAGVAVDAASRGLRVALVERDDFSAGASFNLVFLTLFWMFSLEYLNLWKMLKLSAGTSSKSTKLVHGGVRYLQKAILEFDYEQYKLVREALHERRIFLQTAPYLSGMLPIMLPIYKCVHLGRISPDLKLFCVCVGIGRYHIIGPVVKCMTSWLVRRTWRAPIS
jgi:glycerol-3-phosphate dehydrogenase